MTIDVDPTLQDMLRAAYRLSWPGPAPRRSSPLRRLASLCTPERLIGWPVKLSTPQA